MNERRRVGVFVYEDGLVQGPSDYMMERMDAMLEKIRNGDSAVFNHGMAQPNPDWLMVTLVALQTDYNAWKGMRALRRLAFGE